MFCEAKAWLQRDVTKRRGENWELVPVPKLFSSLILREEESLLIGQTETQYLLETLHA